MYYLSELLRRVDKHSYQERCYSGGEANLDEYIFLTPRRGAVIIY